MSENDPQDLVAKVLERKKESQDWMNQNFYQPWAEVWRSIQCRTEPKKVKDAKGNWVEDKFSTNVCMPDAAVMWLRNVARLTSNPPNINYRVPGEFELTDRGPLADRLSARARMQYDRSGEAIEQRRNVAQVEAFGISVSKLFYDKVEVTRRLRRATINFRDRVQLGRMRGLPQEEIQAQVERLGPELNDSEIAALLLEEGDELRLQVPTVKYEGPVVRVPFIGDLYWEPGIRNFHDSGWVIEEYTETDLWMQKKLKTTYRDPNTGEEKPVFDAKAVKEALEMGSSDLPKVNQSTDFREQLRAVLGQTEQLIPKRLIPGKRFQILECHEQRDGWMWIYYVTNEKILLGQQPYEWDLYGKYVYTPLTTIPDLLHCIGMSTPQLARFLVKLHNENVAQRTDVMNNVLRRTVLTDRLEDMPDEIIEKKNYRVLPVKDIRNYLVAQDPDIPAGAFEMSNELMRYMGQLEPSMTNVEAGTALNPQGGKTATTALLQAKATDVLVQDKVANLNLYLKEVGEKKLWIDQQVQANMEVDGMYARTEALSERYGKTAKILIDWTEIQEDIGVEPEAGSTLAVNDELRRTAAIQVVTRADARPDLYNAYEAEKLLLSTIPGADPTKMLKDPSQEAPPAPDLKASLSIAFKDLPAPWQQELGNRLGMPPAPGLQQGEVVKQVKELAEAGQAADELAKPAESEVGEPEGDRMKKRMKSLP